MSVEQQLFPLLSPRCRSDAFWPVCNLSKPHPWFSCYLAHLGTFLFSAFVSPPPICACFSNSIFPSLPTLFVSLSFPPPTSSVLFSFSFVSPPVSRLPPCFLPHSVRDKFVEVDLKPVCKHCYERLPDDMRRRLAKRERDSKEKKKKPLIPMCLWRPLSICPLPLLSPWSVSFSSALCVSAFSFLFYPVFFLLLKWTPNTWQSLTWMGEIMNEPS